MDNHEYNIYVEIAYQLFQKCFEVSAIEEGKRGWPNLLDEAITSEFPDNHLDKKSLSDLYGRINRLRNENNTYQEMRISEKTLDVLASFALIDDYKTFNRNYKGITAVYSPKPFSFFNFLRIPADGTLYKSEGSWHYKVGNAIVLTGKTATNVEPYCMPGDHFPYWVKVNFTTDIGLPQIAYFAHIDPSSVTLSFLKPEKLLDFF